MPNQKSEIPLQEKHITSRLAALPERAWFVFEFLMVELLWIFCERCSTIVPEIMEGCGLSSPVIALGKKGECGCIE